MSNTTVLIDTVAETVASVQLVLDLEITPIEFAAAGPVWGGVSMNLGAVETLLSVAAR